MGSELGSDGLEGFGMEIGPKGVPASSKRLRQGWRTQTARPAPEQFELTLTQDAQTRR